MATPSQPPIIVTEADQERLSSLASQTMARSPDAAEDLIAEIERATVVPTDSVPAHVVRMGSSVLFRTGRDAPRRVTLVFPGEADIAAGRVSILTPVGTALIGLSEGQSIRWTTRDGRDQQLTVLEVTGPEDERPKVVDFAARRGAPRRPAPAAVPFDDDPGPSAA